MTAKSKVQSIEPNIADMANSWLKSYELDYKLEQESLNTEIDQALNDYFSKNGGKGGNRPDAKLLLRADDGKYYPILIEYKGYEDKLVKLDSEGNVANKNAKNQPDFANINSYAVNGAVHYANAVLHYTSYTDVIAIGVTGHKDTSGKVIPQIGVYYVSKNNFGIGQKVDDFSDLSFLKKDHFNAFIEKVKQLQLTPEEIEKLKERREQEITTSLVKLNNDIFKSEKGLSENDRVYLVAASIMATLGDIDNNVYPLTKADLKSSNERNNTDGDIMLRKIESFLDAKKLPKDKKDLIVRTLQNTLTTDNINKVTDGESQLKRVFVKIVDDLGIYYKIGLTTDFTGKLFNEMYSWLGFTQDQLNDVVLTPSYVATFLCRLARVNKDSYVWDFATGSAGLLVAAMNEMLIDAKNTIKSPEQLAIKSANIKANQLLGLEILSNVYMLAVLNMIMMGDGSSNILKKEGKEAICYGMGDGLEAVERASEVGKNIVISAAALEVAKYLEKTFGTPYEIGYPAAGELVPNLDYQGKKILVVHQQVMAEAIRQEILKRENSAEVQTATWFMRKKELACPQDVSLREEDDYIDLVKNGGFDIIFADACMEKMVPDFQGIFVNTRHFAVSGRLCE